MNQLWSWNVILALKFSSSSTIAVESMLKDRYYCCLCNNSGRVVYFFVMTECVCTVISYKHCYKVLVRKIIYLPSAPTISNVLTLTS